MHLRISGKYLFKHLLRPIQLYAPQTIEVRHGLTRDLEQLHLRGRAVRRANDTKYRNRHVAQPAKTISRDQPKQTLDGTNQLCYVHCCTWLPEPRVHACPLILLLSHGCPHLPRRIVLLGVRAVSASSLLYRPSCQKSKRKNKIRQ